MNGKEKPKNMNLVQRSISGYELPLFPKVRTTDNHLVDWNRDAITKQLIRETKLTETLFGIPPITKEEAEEIAKLTEKHIKEIRLHELSSAMIREIVNTILLERKHPEWRNVSTRVGTPVFDAHLIDTGDRSGFEKNDNANLQDNAETSHKKKADKMCKEQYLLMMPPKLADSHLNGDVHIHDLEYFGTRPFCIDGSTVIPVKSDERTYLIRPDQLRFTGDDYYPEKFSAITPSGPRRIEKITRRKVKENELLKIYTSSGKSLKVTKEHRIPVKDNGMTLKKAIDIKEGDMLYGADNQTLNIRGKPIDHIDLITELTDNVPASLLENVFVRCSKDHFEQILRSGKSKSFTNISKDMGIKHHKKWFSRGIMPITIFRQMCYLYGIKDYANTRIGVTGSEHSLPAILPITSELVKLLGFFVADGNYNIKVKQSYNLAITNNQYATAIQQYATDTLNTYATMAPDRIMTTCCGRNGTWNKAKQVYFGGKLPYLLFRYVLGIPEGCDKKRLPNFVYNLNDDLLHDLLSSLFTCDGTAGYRPEKSDGTISYATTSETLRQELSLVLQSLGMKPTITESPPEKPGYKLLYEIHLYGFKNIETFSKHITFYNDNQNKIDQYLLNINGINRQQKDEKVTKIIPADPSGDYVYDVFLQTKGGDTEKDHTFFASDGLLIHNCSSWDLRYFFYYGLMPDGSGTKASVAGPSKKAEVAMLHAVKAMGSAQTNAAGGQGFYNFLTFIAPYLKGREYKEIEQLMQMFVYEMTQMMVARGGQLVFSSVQLSPGVPKLWRDKPAVYKGKIWDGTQAPLQTYGEFEREVRLGFKALMNVLLGGDYWGKPFNFPKPEISIEPDFIDYDEWTKAFNIEHPDLPTYDELYDMSFVLAAKYGTPYFDNQLPEYRGAGKGISCYQCCAYSFSSVTAQDTLFDDKLHFRNGKHFSMGAWQVMSLNCPRAAYRAEHNDEKLFQELKRLMDIAVGVFRVKRKWMDIIVKSNRMPFFTQRPMDPNTREKGEMAVDLSGLVYEIGVVGINEMVQHHTGKQMHESEEARKLAIRAMFEMKFYAKELSEKYGIHIALARTPAETTAMRFAVSDLLHKEIRGCAEKVIKGDLKTALAKIHETRDLPVYYTNGTHVYVGADTTITERINIEHAFFPILDGGNIMHIFMGEAQPDPKGLKEFAMNIAKNTQTGYFAFTRDMTTCMDCFQTSPGLKDVCPECGSEHVEKLSRVTGYIQAVSGFNFGKQEELRDRKRHDIR